MSRPVLALLELLSGCTCRGPAPATLRPLDAGLPTSGQWRSGFSLVDLDGDGCSAGEASLMAMLGVVALLRRRRAGGGGATS